MRFAVPENSTPRKAMSAAVMTIDLEQRRVAILQMAIPGKSHEDVGEGQEQNRGHANMLP